MMQNNAFYCLKWLPAYCMQGCGIRVSADTKTWATCPTRAVLRYI